MTIILADLGGTHLRLSRSHDSRNIEKFNITEYPDIETVLKQFEADITTLYLASAIQPRNGVIEDKRFGDTSHWTINLETLKSSLKIKDIYVVNDLEAAAFGLLRLNKGYVLDIFRPKVEQNHFINPPKLIVGIGTGIGHAFLFEKEGGDAFVQRSHGGHLAPSAITQEQKDILSQLEEEKPSYRDVIVEDIVSGNGLGHLLKVRKRHDALRIFAEFLGLYCNTLVSVAGAYGGVFLTGGVVNELTSAQDFDEESFKKFFCRPMVPVVVESISSTPVYYIREPNMPILGLSYLSKK